jgi:hypothetical protein
MMLKVVRVRSPFLQVMAGWEDCIVVLGDEDHEVERTVTELLDTGRAIRVDMREARHGLTRTIPAVIQ